MNTKTSNGLLISSRIKLIALAALVAGLASTTHAAIVQVSSTENTPYPSIGVKGLIIYAPNFTTGQSTQQLHSIAMNIGLLMTQEQIDEGFVPSQLLGYLFESTPDGMPNLSLPSLTSFSFNSTDLIINNWAEIRFIADTQVQLKPETTYSFLLHVAQDTASTESVYHVTIADVNEGYSTPGNTGWSLNNIIPASTDGGESFFDLNGQGAAYPQLAVYTVPEPSTYALIGAALALGFVAIKRRKR